MCVCVYDFILQICKYISSWQLTDIFFAPFSLSFCIFLRSCFRFKDCKRKQLDYYCCGGARHALSGAFSIYNSSYNWLIVNKKLFLMRNLSFEIIRTNSMAIRRLFNDYLSCPEQTITATLVFAFFFSIFYCQLRDGRRMSDDSRHVYFW